MFSCHSFIIIKFLIWIKSPPILVKTIKSITRTKVVDKKHEERKTGIEEKDKGSFTILVLPNIHTQQRICHDDRIYEP